VAQLLPQPAPAQLPPQPHVPTEEQLKQRQRGYRVDDTRGYQRNSVETVQSGWQRILGWIRRTLAAIHITPARLLIGLGAIGVLLTWNKNKRHVHWAVITALGWLLLGLGIAAILLAWPAFN